MDAQEHNSFLLTMPELVLENIVFNIHNSLNVARTCKYLYEIVCGMEKVRRVLYITALDATKPLNIDADAVFDSIMNSNRTIKEIELRLGRRNYSTYELNERQLERITAIMKQFGANITSLKFQSFALPINFIHQWLQQVPKLESLSFSYGKAIGSIVENTTMPLQLETVQKKRTVLGDGGMFGKIGRAMLKVWKKPGRCGGGESKDPKKICTPLINSPLSSLKTLEINEFPGLLDIVSLIPDGSLNYCCSFLGYSDQSSESAEVLTTVLTKQHQIKSMTLDIRSNSDLTALSVDNLQLETLIIRSCDVDEDSQFVELLKCQTNLKELRFVSFNFELCGRLFQWICNNLQKLEVFEVQRVDSSIDGNAFEMLDELKKLRHFRTSDSNNLFHNGFQSNQFRSDSIEKFEFGFEPEFSCGELLDRMVKSMVSNLPNLTHLKMRFEDFSALSFVLSHCIKIIHLTCYISDPFPHQLTLQHLPNIQHLEFCNYNIYDDITDVMINRSMISIVCAMPNLKSMSLSTRNGLKFDVQTMKEFIKESKSLEYFYVDRFELYPELSTNDVVETIRCLTDRLKGYRINFSRPITQPNSIWNEIKYILSNEFYVREKCNLLPHFYLYKGEQNKCSSEF